MRPMGAFQNSAMRSLRDALTLGLKRGGISPFTTWFGDDIIIMKPRD